MLLISILTIVMIQCDSSTVQAQNDRPLRDRKSIKLAILLDTSNSMDGLIGQAKSQLWTIVNEMAKAKCDNIKTDLKIALYEYGNSGLPESEGYIRMVTPLTSDLDQISEDLFSLTTNGGQEYCGQVIQTSLKELDWKRNSGDYQVIFIAGNEPFTQGNVSYRTVCREAKERGIVVNTIFCGNFNEGMSTNWKDGADLTGGDYFSIEQNRKTVYISSPYDDKIVQLNQQLNNTYIYYGHQGYEKKALQEKQDSNAESFGAVNSVKRAVSKSSHVYKNKSWDLVDASEESSFDLEEIEITSLPAEMKDMNNEEKEAYINEKKAEREKIKKEINALNVKREEYVHNQQKDNGNEEMLDNAIVSSIHKQAQLNNIVFE